MFIDQIQIVKKPVKEEKKIENQITSWLEKNLEADEYVYYKNWGGGIFGRGGRPDMEIAYRGRIHYFEIKDPEGSLSTLQIEVINKYAKVGIDVQVVDSLELFLKHFPHFEY